MFVVESWFSLRSSFVAANVALAMLTACDGSAEGGAVDTDGSTGDAGPGSGQVSGVETSTGDAPGEGDGSSGGGESSGAPPTSCDPVAPVGVPPSDIALLADGSIGLFGTDGETTVLDVLPCDGGPPQRTELGPVAEVSARVFTLLDDGRPVLSGPSFAILEEDLSLTAIPSGLGYVVDQRGYTVALATPELGVPCSPGYVAMNPDGSVLEYWCDENAAEDGLTGPVYGRDGGGVISGADGSTIRCWSPGMSDAPNSSILVADLQLAADSVKRTVGSGFSIPTRDGFMVAGAWDGLSNPSSSFFAANCDGEVLFDIQLTNTTPHPSGQGFVGDTPMSPVGAWNDSSFAFSFGAQYSGTTIGGVSTNSYFGIVDRATGASRVGMPVQPVHFIAADATGNFWLSMQAGGLVVVDENGAQIGGDGVL